MTLTPPSNPSTAIMAPNGVLVDLVSRDETTATFSLVISHEALNDVRRDLWKVIAPEVMRQWQERRETTP